MRDPHDDLMLTDRDTTIVTQATALDDTMPDPYGSSQDEEALFSDVGADDGGKPNKARMARTARKTSQRAPGMWLEADDATGPADVAAAMTPVVPPAMPLKNMAMLVGGVFALVFALRRVI